MNVKRAASLFLVAAIVSGCQAAQSGGNSAAPASAASPSPSTPESIPETTDEATSAPAPTVTPPPLLAIDSVAQAIVPDLRVREDAGLSGRILGTLPLNAESLVVDGPVSADGYTWYAIQALGLPWGTGCEAPITSDPYNCPYWYGWVAAYGPDGYAWLSEVELACGPWPAPKLTDQFNYWLPYLGYLACFGGEERHIVGYYPSIPEDAGLGGTCVGVPDEVYWLACNLGYEFLVADPADGYFGTPFILAVPPGLEMPARGQWIEVIGHYDDPTAQECDFGSAEAGPPPQARVTLCRGQFVISTIGQ